MMFRVIFTFTAEMKKNGAKNDVIGLINLPLNRYNKFKIE
jgi:hypothetical protein